MNTTIVGAGGGTPSAGEIEVTSGTSAIVAREKPVDAAIERTPWLPYLSDRADGVKGHYALARWNPAGYREVWNLRSHQWTAFSDDVLTLDEALGMLRTISFHPMTPSLRSQ